ncbi:hypothetical protein U9M48_015926, partial [Paspalum notatum var. saurae]
RGGIRYHGPCRIAADSKASEIKSDDGSAANENVNAEGSKGKRERGKAVDLRFKDLDENISVSKKQKMKNARAIRQKPFQTSLGVRKSNLVKLLRLHQSEERFGCSLEMLRKEAIENYRNIKGWTSRPGLQLPA